MNSATVRPKKRRKDPRSVRPLRLYLRVSLNEARLATNLAPTVLVGRRIDRHVNEKIFKNNENTNYGLSANPCLS